MNKVILIGRLTREPDIRWTQGQDQKCMARYTLAVDRQLSREVRERDGVQTADFVSCVAFGRAAEFAEKYFVKGTKVAIEGRIQTGSYTNREGQKVYTTDVVVEKSEFCEKKESGSGTADQRQEHYYTRPEDADGFIDIPNGVEDDGLPFN